MEYGWIGAIVLNILQAIWVFSQQQERRIERRALRAYGIDPQHDAKAIDINQLQRDIESLRTDLNHSNALSAEKDKVITNLSDQLNKASARLDQMDGEIKQLRTDLQGKADALAEAQRQNSKLETEVQVKDATITLLEKLIAAPRPVVIYLNEKRVDPDDNPDPTPPGPGGPGGKDKDNVTDFVDAVGKPLPEAKDDKGLKKAS